MRTTSSAATAWRCASQGGWWGEGWGPKTLASLARIPLPAFCRKSITHTKIWKATMRHTTPLLLLLLSTMAIAEPIDPNDIRVIDGDTIRVYHQQPNVRLVGFNAPETRNAACTAEAELGARATHRLRDLI